MHKSWILTGSLNRPVDIDSQLIVKLNSMCVSQLDPQLCLHC